MEILLSFETDAGTRQNAISTNYNKFGNSSNTPKFYKLIRITQ